VSLSQIRYFVAVAEEGHVGRAAQRLCIAQPPLSRQIRSLEDELGAPLFVRTARGMRLLPTGVAFLAHARAILSQVDAAVDAVRREGAPVPSHPPKDVDGEQMHRGESLAVRRMIDER
jgi:DNA-binding transcriptional LysR family regulator